MTTGQYVAKLTILKTQIFRVHLNEFSKTESRRVDDESAAGQHQQLCDTGGMLAAADFLAQLSSRQTEARLNRIEQ